MKSDSGWVVGLGKGMDMSCTCFQHINALSSCFMLQHIFVDILYETLRVFRERDGTSMGFAQTHCFSQAPQVLSCTHAQLSFVFRKIMHELRVFLFSHEQFPSSFFSFLIRIRDIFLLINKKSRSFDEPLLVGFDTTVRNPATKMHTF